MSPHPPKPDPATEANPLACFHLVTAEWFRAVFDAPTAPQRLGWPVIARRESALILAPTGTGKTLTAFLWCLDRLMLHDIPPPKSRPGCRLVYVSPLKALAVDVERNLRSPLAGIANMARRRGVPFHEPLISVRTGDTPQRERARFRRQPADILITTPESLYLLLTSQAADALRTVDTVILDEIHSLVPTKRGAHLALSLERLQALTKRPLQRIGLSATQRPLEEVARFLGGVDIPVEISAVTKLSRASNLDISTDSGEEPQVLNESQNANSWSSNLPDAAALRFRPVTIVNASHPKQLSLRIEVPVEDMARLNAMEEIPSGPASQMPRRVSIWNAIHPRLLELIRQRNSTLLFVNSRQVAERLAGALNELAGEPLARAHHGSLAAHQRSVIEEQLKAGQIRALCATSTLELGIDMGAIDLVIQIEAPPSVASGMQRIGRAGHTVDAVSEGVLFPKYRADLVACAAVTQAMHQGHIESTSYPRNPLDVLCQQLVAIVAHPPGAPPLPRKPKPCTILPGIELPPDPVPEVSVDFLFDLVRRSAPFASLTRSTFEGVLDLLSGRYPSDEFAELRPRLTWDRIRNVVSPRAGAARLAILNAGTIPDRGLYGVFLAHTEGKSIRVGELDEEMVFESHPNE
ncbi:MAG TPA: DEAD/DEAH box helicase, partial [Terracidiphilus sp.]|nr:DEAD/DEAH box helicase [Terracidiphilus sp.]